jgi:hypothetical protein
MLGGRTLGFGPRKEATPVEGDRRILSRSNPAVATPGNPRGRPRDEKGHLTGRQEHGRRPTVFRQWTSGMARTDKLVRGSMPRGQYWSVVDGLHSASRLTSNHPMIWHANKEGRHRGRRNGWCHRTRTSSRQIRSQMTRHSHDSNNAPALYLVGPAQHLVCTRTIPLFGEKCRV